MPNRKTEGDNPSAPTAAAARGGGNSLPEVASEGPESFDLRSHTISEDKLQELLRLFPEVQSEGGKVDFNRLKLALGESVDAGKERYGLSWPGKADCFRAIQTPSRGTLLPVPDQSVNWDTTHNLIIEGDNLEVLKLLQKSYLGKVKMIYIDPPYNTGNDFIYPDNYAESLQTYLEYTGQVDSQGKKFSTNADTEGRFHSKWLNMMYPRLYLSRNLLRDDGVLFVSIDDTELANLRGILDEILGAENFLGVLVWITATDNNATQVATQHEYVVCYARDADQQPDWERPSEKAKLILAEHEKLRKKHGRDTDAIEENLSRWIRQQSDDGVDLSGVEHYCYVDERGVFYPGNSANPHPGGYTYDILHPRTGKPCAKPANGYRWPKETFEAAVNRGDVLWGRDEKGVPKIKKRLETATEILRSTYYEDNRRATRELATLMGGKLFDNPKSPRLIRRLIDYTTSDHDIVLDFFAGSGTTAQAVVEANVDDGNSRKFVLVQLPEPTPEDSEARKAGFPTISSFCEERVRRVLKAMDGAAGFRILRLAESNFKVWDSARPEHPDVLQRRLTDHIHHIREGRSEQDILTELLLKSGFPPTVSVQEVSVAEKKAFVVGDGELLICLDRHLTLEAIRAIADLHPKRVVCLDEGFEGNDQLKVNAAQTFKTKGITFQTV
jgi:adenine-specific DNA-methyltransferase